MKTNQSGFTLIELIIVIVILGALAAVALPRFVDLQTDADAAALEGVAGGMSSAMAVNFAGCSVARHTPGANCIAVSNCDEVGTVMQTGVPNNYTVASAAIGGGTNGESDPSCTVTQDNTGDTANFTGIVAGQ